MLLVILMDWKEFWNNRSPFEKICLISGILCLILVSSYLSLLVSIPWRIIGVYWSKGLFHQIGIIIVLSTIITLLIVWYLRYRFNHLNYFK
jgi:hypothetical protein